MESVNFVHDVNTLRKTLKSVYTTSADLRALNAEIGEGPGNCRIQVLPVCWRHLLDFPKKREEKKGEQDIGDVSGEEDECECNTISLAQSLTVPIQIPAWKTLRLKAWRLPDP